MQIFLPNTRSPITSFEIILMLYLLYCYKLRHLADLSISIEYIFKTINTFLNNTFPPSYHTQTHLSNLLKYHSNTKIKLMFRARLT